MRTQYGMRPHDIVVLYKMLVKDQSDWPFKSLADELFLSPAEIGIALDRCHIAGLVKAEKKKVNKQTFVEFIEYGLHVVFPVVPGGIVNGIATAHSHSYMRQFFPSIEPYVWPDSQGRERGQSVQPLYKNAVKAALADEKLYKMLALTDVVR